MTELAIRGYAKTPQSRYYLRNVKLKPCVTVKPRDEELCEKNKAIIESSRRSAEQRRKFSYLY